MSKKKSGLLSQVGTLKKVCRYIVRYIPLLIVSIILATVSVAMTLYFPIITGEAVDLICIRALLILQEFWN